MKLLRLCAHEIKIGRPLPWGVRNEPGQLLLNKGAVLREEHQIETLLERGVYVDADEYEEEQRREHQARAAKAADPFSVWSEIQRQVGHLLRHHDESQNYQGDITTLGEQIRSAIGKDVDLGKFQMIQNESTNYGVTHSLQTAFVAYLAAERLGASESERAVVVSAALTMNIAMLELQNVLVSQTTPLTPEQRHVINHHAQASSEILQERGVTQRDWLEAIEHHHPTQGGQPLPTDPDTALSEVGCLIHYVDVYLAKLSARATRPALASQAAAQQLFLTGGGGQQPFHQRHRQGDGHLPTGYVREAGQWRDGRGGPNGRERSHPAGARLEQQRRHAPHGARTTGHGQSQVQDREHGAPRQHPDQAQSPPAAGLFTGVRASLHAGGHHRPLLAHVALRIDALEVNRKAPQAADMLEHLAGLVVQGASVVLGVAQGQ
jgi:hypothetical protein